MSGKHVEKERTKASRILFEIVLILIIILLCIALYFKTNDSQPVTEVKAPTATPTPEVVETTEAPRTFYTLKGEGVKFMEMDGAFFRPADPFTHAEMVKMIYSLLGTDKVGTATFTDVSEDDDCYNAAATLKTLGIISGARLHPDEPVTFLEFCDVLSYFGKTCDDSEQDMTRRDAVEIMSALLGRTPDKNFDKIGTILDVSKKDKDFYIIADAALTGKLDVKEGGYFFFGNTLRLIDEDGCVVADKTVDGFTFDGNGKFTSGNRELDAVVQQIISQVLVDTIEHPFHDKQGNLNKGDEYALKLLYQYVIKNSKYVPRNFYDMGDTSWAADEAYVMLTEHRGNCYNFAAAFYELARAIGYEAELYSGTMGENDDPHAWVEIYMEGEDKLFDPEVEYTKNSWDFISYFKRSQSFASKYDYKKE